MDIACEFDTTHAGARPLRLSIPLRLQQLDRHRRQPIRSVDIPE